MRPWTTPGRKQSWTAATSPVRGKCVTCYLPGVRGCLDFHAGLPALSSRPPPRGDSGTAQRGRSHQKVIRELIQHGLPLLTLGAASTESFQSTSRKILGPVPSRDRRQHASALTRRVADVEQQLAAAQDQTLPHASGILVTAIGQDLDEPSVSRQLRDRRSGTE